MENQIEYDQLNPFIKAVVGEPQGSNQPQQLNLANVQFLPAPVDRAVRDITRGAGSAIERGYGQLDKNVFGGLLPRGAESVYGKMRRLLDDVPVAQQKPQATPQAQPPATTTEEPSTKLPGDQPTPVAQTTGSIFDAILRSADRQYDYLREISSPERQRQQSQLRREELAYATDLLSKAQMGQMREKTRRDTIEQWRKLESDKIRANTVMATAMMNTAYLAATPNANVLSALNVASDSAMRAFQPGQAVI